jgi:hypothetical protein
MGYIWDTDEMSRGAKRGKKFVENKWLQNFTNLPNWKIANSVL